MKKELREKVWNKFGKRCAYCGEVLKYDDMQVDHVMCKANFDWYINMNVIVPDFLQHLTINDVDHIDNLFPSCRQCNKRKDTFSIEQFRKELYEALDRTYKYCSGYRFAVKYDQVKETRRQIIFHFEKFK